LAETAAPGNLVAVVSLQFFAVGGGEGREEVTESFRNLDVPVIKAVRLADRTVGEWRFSQDGIPADDIYFRVAMPELQGISQPMLVAAATPPRIDERTGIRLVLTRPVPSRIEALGNRIERWRVLQTRDNSDKRVAIVYYNHPPGRHNIGADKLNVPESLFEILHRMEAAGYETGPLPETADALLERMQASGVNLPQDRRVLADMAETVPTMTTEAYRAWFRTLPESVQAEMVNGPLGYLHARLERAMEAAETDMARRLLEDAMAGLRHLVDNHEHPSQRRAIRLLDQYEAGWSARIEGRETEEDLSAIRDALTRTGIPGLSGWGEPPGRSMVHDDRLVFPGLRFGNVFIGPQPPRGWEVRESLLHANTTFPPTHQYAGFYYWLREQFEADALVYMGRHSTREFLPRRRAGLAEDDYPELLGGDLPLIYPYIVDGVGEGIQAKRRALAVIVSHLTPPLAATELYDQLLELRQLVESWESGAGSQDGPARQRTVSLLREKIQALELTSVIEEEIAHETGVSVSEVSLDEVSNEQLVHEAGHYVTHMQEDFMPLGLHVFGRDWDEEALDTMLESMAGDGEPGEDWRERLAESPAREMEALLAGLDGRFIRPGQGNDPIRTAEVLPTGHNFHALSGDLIPTRVAWSLAQELAADARDRGDPRAEGSEALVLWASDTVRDEGVMIAFGLDMLGVKPRWNSRGIVKGLERMPLADGRRRRDVLFTTSGLFRDLYGDQLVMLDRAVRVALDGASQTIRDRYPGLAPALASALAPLPEGLRDAGSESLANNDVAARWVADTRSLMGQGQSPQSAGRAAALRVFGTAPGTYGAGVNRLADRSGAWSNRIALADAYIRRMGHAYGDTRNGRASHAAFQQRLNDVGRTYLGRSSHLYGLLDRDDGFDFQGGLSNAVEELSGQAPDNRLLMHADPENLRVDSLESALVRELQGRNLNPQWLRPLMEQGYAGARTMARDFLDNLWGWQVTTPDVVDSWVWDEVDAVYFQDRHDLGMDEFLRRDNNVHVKNHMQALMLVAAHREFWEASPERIREMARDFAESVVEHGLPGSGHANPDHPTMDWVAEKLTPEQREAFEATLDQARLDEAPESEPQPSRIAELEPQADDAEPGERDDRQQDPSRDSNETEASARAGVQWAWLLGIVILTVFIAGVVAGRRR
jgi:cobaltochelatase CobN